MSLDLKHVDLTSFKQYQSKPYCKPYHLQKSAFDLLTRLHGNGDAVGAMFAGVGIRYVLNVLTGFMQMMRKRLYRPVELTARSGRWELKSNNSRIILISLSK
jgi:hypothetical protein